MIISLVAYIRVSQVSDNIIQFVPTTLGTNFCIYEFRALHRALRRVGYYYALPKLSHLTKNQSIPSNCYQMFRVADSYIQDIAEFTVLEYSEIMDVDQDKLYEFLLVNNSGVLITKDQLRIIQFLDTNIIDAMCGNEMDLIEYLLYLGGFRAIEFYSVIVLMTSSEIYDNLEESEDE